MNEIKNPTQLLAAFPQLGFNLNNSDIVTKYAGFLEYALDEEIVLNENNIRLHVREFFKEEYGVTFPRVNKNSSKFWIARGFSEEEAKVRTKEFYDTKIKNNRVLPTQLAYYTNQGLSEEDAQTALAAEQAKRSKKLTDKEIANPMLRKQRLWNNIEYWLNKGFTEIQGIQLIEEKFKSRNLQTMVKLTKKFQDKGMDYDDALESAQKDYKKRARKIMDTRIENNSFGFQKASKQSLKVFQPLMDKLDAENIEYFVGVEGNTEYFLASGSDYFYSYDFCIPSKKLIIEFNGEHVHPNPKMDIESWNDWKHCWTKKSADECRAEDVKKIELAESKGFKVIELFESDVVDLLGKFEELQ
jgi:hypothetical protein